MRFNKLTAMFLAVLMTVCLSGCRGNESGMSSYSDVPGGTDTSSVSSRDYINLLYSAADTFNPYTLKTDVNRQICKLLYEPLVKVDNEFQPVYSLAESVSNKGKTCTVTLRNAKFSDGTAVTASDVKYSYELAKNSNTTYGKKLYEVESVSVSGNKVVFSLEKTDPYFMNLLDFPIIKSGSDKKTDSDSVAIPPIGCGRYKLNAEGDGMVINDNFFGEQGHILKIRLINAPDSESVAHYTEIGAADMYFSEISDGNILRMSGARQEINLNNMVFIGINRNYEPLDREEIRQALSTALNRVKICEEAYYNNAVPATGFFHPEWSVTKSVQNIEIVTNREITVENLERIGYNKLDKGQIRMNSAGSKLNFTLLVNSENRIRVLAANVIAEQLKSCGIGITVVEKKYSQYKDALKKGEFQLYLGEVKFTDNMDISSLIMEGGSAAFGLPVKDNSEEEESVSSNYDSSGESSGSSQTGGEDTQETLTSSQVVIERYYAGKATIKDVASVLQTEMPVVPVCFRTGVLFYNEDIKNVEKSSLSDIYFSINSYLIN